MSHTALAGHHPAPLHSCGIGFPPEFWGAEDNAPRLRCTVPQQLHSLHGVLFPAYAGSPVLLRQSAAMWLVFPDRRSEICQTETAVHFCWAFRQIPWCHALRIWHSVRSDSTGTHWRCTWDWGYPGTPVPHWKRAVCTGLRRNAEIAAFLPCRAVGGWWSLSSCSGLLASLP